MKEGCSRPALGGARDRCETEFDSRAPAVELDCCVGADFGSFRGKCDLKSRANSGGTSLSQEKDADPGGEISVRTPRPEGRE